MNTAFSPSGEIPGGIPLGLFLSHERFPAWRISGRISPSPSLVRICMKFLFHDPHSSAPHMMFPLVARLVLAFQARAHRRPFSMRLSRLRYHSVVSSQFRINIRGPDSCMGVQGIHDVRVNRIGEVGLVAGSPRTAAALSEMFSGTSAPTGSATTS